MKNGENNWAYEKNLSKLQKKTQKENIQISFVLLF